MQTKLRDSRNNLAEDTKLSSVATLNATLAGLIDLASQYKEAHWNVRGPHFIALHDLFDKLAGELPEGIDDIAERVTALGGLAKGTVRQAAAASGLAELPNATEGLALVRHLADHAAALGKAVREAVDVTAAAGDAGTADLLTGLSRLLDKQLWFLEAHLA